MKLFAVLIFAVASASTVFAGETETNNNNNNNNKKCKNLLRVSV
jgi:hypothetical protein